MAKKPKGCPHCGREIKWRGVCLRCYFVGRRKVLSGKATDSQLVALGWWKESGSSPRGDSAAKLTKLLGK